MEWSMCCVRRNVKRAMLPEKIFAAGLPKLTAGEGNRYTTTTPQEIQQSQTAATSSHPTHAQKDPTLTGILILERRGMQAPSPQMGRGGTSGLGDACLPKEKKAPIFWAVSLYTQLNSKLFCHLVEMQDFKRNALCQAGMETQNLKGFHDSII